MPQAAIFDVDGTSKRALTATVWKARLVSNLPTFGDAREGHGQLQPVQHGDK